MSRGDHIAWLPPDLSSEKNAVEIARAAETLGTDTATVRQAIEGGMLTPLEPDVWVRLENTDSLDVESIRDLRGRAHARGKKIRGVFEEYILARVNAPIVLKCPDCYLLVNGNTRLSVAHLFDITPQVWMGELQGY